MTVEEFYNQEMNTKPSVESCFANTIGITYCNGEIEQKQIHSIDEMTAFAEAYHQTKLLNERKFLPDNVNSEKEHLQYLKDIGIIKKLQHHKDTTIGLYAFDKNINKIFEEIPTECKTITEQLMLNKINYLKNIVFQIK